MRDQHQNGMIKQLLICCLALLAACSGKVTVSRNSNGDAEFTMDFAGGAAAAVEPIAKVAVTQNEQSLSALFRNDYFNESITVYWVSDTGEEVSMGDIPQQGNTNLNTFMGHVFLARTVDSHHRAYPNQVTISAGRRAYAFGPPPQASSGHTDQQRQKLFFQFLNHRTTATSAKFRCLVPKGVDIYYEDGRGGLTQGALSMGQEYTVNTYDGHVFFFTQRGDKNREVARFTIDSQRVLYLVQDPAAPPEQRYLDHRDREEAFMAEYLARTGRQWRHYFGPDGPRGPPGHFMWPAQHKGQVHEIASSEGFWHCKGSKAECQSSSPVQLRLEVLSTAPKVFVVPQFISDYEVDAILAVAKPRVADSFVGNNDGGGARKSDTRTSKNTWIPRTTDEVMDSLFRRAEHLLQIPRLDASNTEDLQVVHYTIGQKYDNHHDWGVSGYPESRYLTLLLYLNDMASETAGGETAFPKGAEGMGFKTHPGKGSAVLFYDLLEDGNGDDLSLHAALPLFQGEKWVANFWVWDPARK